MTKKIIFSFIVILSSLQFSNAQTDVQAGKILDDLLTTAKTSAIKTNFKLLVTVKADPQPQVATGTFTLKGTKFVLDMNQMKIWFDGKTQWAYAAKNNEVSVTEPTEKELAETNPMSIISTYKSKSSIRFSPKSKSAQNHVIEMTPKIKNKDISKIEIEINKSTGNLAYIKLNYFNGGSSMLTLSNFEKGVKVADNIFAFNPARYKGVSINDLR
jgi:outer membrane lipoprotein-sorting protein